MYDTFTTRLIKLQIKSLSLGISFCIWFRKGVKGEWIIVKNIFIFIFKSNNPETLRAREQLKDEEEVLNGGGVDREELLMRED